MTSESLATAIARVGNPVELLRNAAARAPTFPVTPEFTNWRSEQRAWAESCALLDQSHREAPNSAKPQVEEHELCEIRATVAPVPYVQFARQNYRSK